MTCHLCKHQFGDDRVRCPACGTTRRSLPKGRRSRATGAVTCPSCVACLMVNANRACPECGHAVHQNCLYGHLRAEHGYTADQAKAAKRALRAGRVAR